MCLTPSGDRWVWHEIHPRYRTRRQGSLDGRAGKPVRSGRKARAPGGGLYASRPNYMNNDPDNDEIRQKVDEDGLLDDLADELVNGDADDALDRMENLGYDVDDLPL